MDRVKGKVAIITGSGSGIGEAAAKKLAAEGARVAVIDIDDENGQRVAQEIKAAGGAADFWHMNIGLEKEVERVFNEIVKKYGQLDILVNNAAVTGVARPTHETASEDWDAVININLKGTFFCNKYAIPWMIKGGGGSVINISSIMGILAGPATIYNTSKAAIRHLTKNDAATYASYKIRFNSVHPGFIVTPLFKKLAAKSPLGVEGSIKTEGEAIPLKRMGYPDDIANGILYLASDEASYVTGIELIIDGGKVMI
jgi:NAD(P)-dependent dehydrogenase (short-subunit alcohol dehydrogenase family)